MEDRHKDIHFEQEMILRKTRELEAKERVVAKREKDGLVLQKRVEETKRCLDEQHARVRRGEADLARRVEGVRSEEKTLLKHIEDAAGRAE